MRRETFAYKPESPGVYNSSDKWHHLNVLLNMVRKRAGATTRPASDNPHRRGATNAHGDYTCKRGRL